MLSDAAWLSELINSNATRYISPEKKGNEVAKRWFILSLLMLLRGCEQVDDAKIAGIIAGMAPVHKVQKGSRYVY
jgi:hypothetical protein